MMRLTDAASLSAYREELQKESKKNKPLIIIAGGTCGFAQGAKAVIDEFKKQIIKNHLNDTIDINITGCHGFCGIEPIVIIQLSRKKPGILYCRLTPSDVQEILTETVINGRVIDRFLYEDPDTGKKITNEDEIPFYKHQTRILTSIHKDIDPTDIKSYIKICGYSALSKALMELRSDEIIDIVKSSGLRGRGGAGFPTGKKWESCKKSTGKIKYVICNADEGDPGAYANRNLLESNPHSVLEGMIIGAYAIGANEGYIYVRTEYPLALQYFSKAIKDAERLGLLGKNILGSGFDFIVKVAKGSGAFVCGESTALMASIEGKLGEPRAKFIHTTEKGLWDRPTTLNNVETWANIPIIINKGLDWYTSIGTENSKGTKIFSLVGKINNTGLVEVPMGITIREIIYKIGGGIKEGKKFKAIQIGGPSGGCVSEQHLDEPVDFDQLPKIGAMMGSGGMIVMDEETCMVDVAKYFLNFLSDESCGKCASCREGLIQMHGIVKEITEGKALPGDIELLQELARYVKIVSLCQLGKTASNPVLTTLNYFKDEYIAHIKDKKCPAGICRTLVIYEINQDICTGCGICILKCPYNAITGKKKEPHKINQNKCVKCGICYENCRFKAIKKI